MSVIPKNEEISKLTGPAVQITQHIDQTIQHIDQTENVEGAAQYSWLNYIKSWISYSNNNNNNSNSNSKIDLSDFTFILENVQPFENIKYLVDKLILSIDILYLNNDMIDTIILSVSEIIDNIDRHPDYINYLKNLCVDIYVPSKNAHLYGEIQKLISRLEGQISVLDNLKLDNTEYLLLILKELSKVLEILSK